MGMFLLGLLLLFFVFPVLIVGLAIRYKNKDQSWKKWAKWSSNLAVFSLVIFVLGARAVGKEQAKQDADRSAAEAPYVARTACENALGGEITSTVYKNPPGEVFDPPPRNADGSYTINSRKVSAKDTSSWPPLWVGQCVVKDGNVTITQHYRQDGYYPGVLPEVSN